MTRPAPSMDAFVDAIAERVAQRVTAELGPLLDAKAAMSVEEAADRLGVGSSLLWRLVKTGEVHVTRIAGRTLISAEEVDRLAREGAA